MKRKTPRQLKAKDVPKLRAFLHKKQDEICPLCEEFADDPCLDHSHQKKNKGTGLIRGVLCRKCNVFIAKSENNCTRYGIDPQDLPRILRNCANYLERKHLPYIHPSEAPKKLIVTKNSYNKLAKAYKGKAKLPEYKTRKKGKTIKNVQGLTKPLERLFQEYGIEPEFYKQ